MTETLRALSYLPPRHGRDIWGFAVLPHDERRVRRRAIELLSGDTVLVDFPSPVTLEHGGALELDNGMLVEIQAGEELLYEVRGRDGVHLMQLCWHLGNRHLKVEIQPDGPGEDGRILILRDHVIRDMLLGLGATVSEILSSFHPMEGAYSHSHGSDDHALRYRK